MAVGNLEFIKSASGSSVSSLSVTDCFSDTYDVYKIAVRQDTGAGNSVKTQLIDSGGSTITTSDYAYAQYQMRSNTSFSDADRTTSTDSMRLFLQGTDDSGTTMYIFNPFSSSSYTFGLAQQSVYYGGAGIPLMGIKSIGVLKLTTSCTGIIFTPISGTFTDIDVSVYGLASN